MDFLVTILSLFIDADIATKWLTGRNSRILTIVTMFLLAIIIIVLLARLIFFRVSE